MAEGLLHGFRARQLAAAYRDLGRVVEAEGEFRRAVAEQPRFMPAWVGLAELLAGQGRRAELAEVLRRIECQPNGPAAAAELRGRFGE